MVIGEGERARYAFSLFVLVEIICHLKFDVGLKNEPVRLFAFVYTFQSK